MKVNGKTVNVVQQQEQSEVVKKSNETALDKYDANHARKAVKDIQQFITKSQGRLFASPKKDWDGNIYRYSF